MKNPESLKKTSTKGRVTIDTREVNGRTEYKRFIDKKTFKLGHKLYNCDVETGIVSEQKLIKTTLKRKGGKARKAWYLWASDNIFYLTAVSIMDAGEKFQMQFDDMEHNLKEHYREVEEAKELESKLKVVNDGDNEDS